MSISVHYSLADVMNPGGRIGPRSKLPARFTAVYDAPKMPRVELDVTTESGVVVCDAVRVQRRENGPSLSGQELRRIPVPHIIDFACRAAGLRISEISEGHYMGSPSRYGSVDQLAEFQRDVDGARRRRTMTDDLLLDVARVYREHKDHNPTQAVREAFIVSNATAARWVRKARDRNFLGPAIKGKPGEAQPEKSKRTTGKRPVMEP